MNIDLVALREKLATRQRLETRLDGFRESAVLVPILSAGGRDEIVLTVRRDDLPTHAGQVSFPGGKRDPRDIDAAATAIRETTEELGVEPAAVEVLGWLDDVPTPTKFVITPVVARIAGPIDLRPNAAEVAEVVRCPVTELARPELWRNNGTRSFLGVEYAMLEFPCGRHKIWGATARILRQLVDQL